MKIIAILAGLLFANFAHAAGLGPSVNSNLGCTNSGDAYQYNGSAMACSPSSSGGATFTQATEAAAGSTQGTATALTATFNLVTSASANLGVIIQSLTNQLQIISNTSANPINLYPVSGMAFGSGTTNAAVSIPAGLSFGIIVANSTTAIIVFNSSQF